MVDAKHKSSKRAHHRGTEIAEIIHRLNRFHRFQRIKSAQIGEICGFVTLDAFGGGSASLWWRFMQNKPNSPEACRAKQSQFGLPQMRAKCIMGNSLGTIQRDTGLKKQSQSRRRRVGRGRRGEGRVCKTNPIRPVGRGPGEQNAQNEPNCPKRGTEAVSGLGIEDESTPGRPRVARGGRNVRNKTRPTKVPESGFDPRFWADIKGRFG